MDFSELRKGFFASMQALVEQQAQATAKPVRFSAASKTCTPCAANARIAKAKAKYFSK